MKKLQQFIKENGSIRFCIHSDTDGFWAESTNVNTIYSSGKTYNALMENLKDAVFTHFEIPAKDCNEKLLKIESEMSTKLVYA